MQPEQEPTACPCGDNAGERVGGQRDAAAAAALAPNAGTPAPHQTTTGCPTTKGISSMDKFTAKVLSVMVSLALSWFACLALGLIYVSATGAGSFSWSVLWPIGVAWIAYGCGRNDGAYEAKAACHQ